MLKLTASPPMAGAIAMVDAELAAIGAPPRNWAVFHTQVDVMVDRLKREAGAVFRDGNGGVIRVRICGLEASSTMGAQAALRHWLSRAKMVVQLPVEVAL